MLIKEGDRTIQLKSMTTLMGMLNGIVFYEIEQQGFSFPNSFPDAKIILSRKYEFPVQQTSN